MLFKMSLMWLQYDSFSFPFFALSQVLLTYKMKQLLENNNLWVLSSVLSSRVIYI